MELKVAVRNFLKNANLFHEDIEFQKECDVFLADMQDGLDGKDNCLDMLPTYIPMINSVKVNEKVIVIDAGGTNLRVAVVHFDNDKQPVIEDFSAYPMPGAEKAIDRIDFFKTIAGYLKPVIHKSDKIGFCFSYPTEILPNGDGKLIRFTKEIRVERMEGKAVGEGLVEALSEMGISGAKKVVLLNDTVATLLGGKATFAKVPYDSFIGFILGTGTNTCYIEGTGKISKIKDVKIDYDNMLINMESGSYGKAPNSTVDLEFELSTVNPGKASFEKKISGGYLGGLVLQLLKSASNSELFSEKFRKGASQLTGLSTVEVNDFLLSPFGDNTIGNLCESSINDISSDQTTAFYLIDAVIERAAKLVAINLTSVMLKTGKGSNPCRPICVTADGSTFYKLKTFRQKLDFYIKTELNDKRGIYCEFVEVQNANLTGSAIAALSKLS